MKFPRCYLARPDWKGDLIVPGKDAAHYLRNVLRLAAGDKIEAFDGAGTCAIARVEKTDPMTLRIAERRCRQVESAARLTLIQALPKGSRMDWIVEKTTELGVSSIWPVVTERCVSRPVGDRSGKHTRWRTIAESAARQSGRGLVPEISPVATIEDALSRCGEFDVVFAGILTEEARPLRDVVRDFTPGSALRVALVVGPEGDFTEGERERLGRAGVIAVRYAPTTLRVETAAVAGIAVLAAWLL